jgi:hypothetical protein
MMLMGDCEMVDKKAAKEITDKAIDCVRSLQNMITLLQFSSESIGLAGAAIGYIQILLDLVCCSEKENVTKQNQAASIEKIFCNGGFSCRVLAGQRQAHYKEEFYVWYPYSDRTDSVRTINLPKMPYDLSLEEVKAYQEGLNVFVALLENPPTYTTQEGKIAQWISKHYPDGVIDWKAEYDRLLSVLSQALPAINVGKPDASTKLLATAVECGEALLEK